MKVLATIVMLLAIAIAIVPIFTDCEADGRRLTLADGRQTSMKCHWTGRAELGLGLPIFAVGATMLFSRRKESRRMLGIAGTSLGAVAILLPTTLIGVCMNPDMPCVSTMKPSLILMGTLVIGVSLVAVVLSWRQEALV